jgi:hypothetical protein
MRLGPILSQLGMSLYAFDKYLWLVGSGRFYPSIRGGRELKIGSQTTKFIHRVNATNLA